MNKLFWFLPLFRKILSSYQVVYMTNNKEYSNILIYIQLCINQWLTTASHLYLLFQMRLHRCVFFMHFSVTAISPSLCSVVCCSSAASVSYWHTQTCRSLADWMKLWIHIKPTCLYTFFWQVYILYKQYVWVNNRTVLKPE